MLIARQRRGEAIAWKRATRASSEIAVHILRVTIDLVQLFPDDTAQARSGAT